MESAVYEAERTVITVRPIKSFGFCPSCGAASRRVHSHYRRHVADLPLVGRSVQLVLVARRFRCDAVLCGRQIFTERSPTALWLHRRDGRRGSTVLSTTSVWRSAEEPAAGFAKRQKGPVRAVAIGCWRSLPPSCSGAAATAAVDQV